MHSFVSHGRFGKSFLWYQIMLLVLLSNNSNNLFSAFSIVTTNLSGNPYDDHVSFISKMQAYFNVHTDYKETKIGSDHMIQIICGHFHFFLLLCLLRKL